MRAISGLISGLVALATASPVTQPLKRYDTANGDDSGISTASAASKNVFVLQYALTLEHLEAAFYYQGLKNFTQGDFAINGYNSEFYGNMLRLIRDEATHVSFLTSVLNSIGQPVPEACDYSFPYSDVKSFLKLASILEGVGVSAYSGAATSVSDPNIITAAASVLSVEARHASYLRSGIGGIPYASPFDVPLDFNQVYSLASQFIVSCPDSVLAPLGLQGFPALSTNNTGQIRANDMITLSAPALASSGSISKRQDNGTVLAPTPDPIMQTMATPTDITGITPLAVGVASTSVPALPGPVALPTALASAIPAVPASPSNTTIQAAFLTVNGPVFAAATQIAPGTFSVRIPATVAGQVYVILTSSATDVSDASTLAGPAILEVQDNLVYNVDALAGMAPMPPVSTTGGAAPRDCI